MFKHVVIAKNGLWIRGIIEVQVSKNILMETKLSAELIRIIVLYEKVILTVVRDKTRMDTHKISKVNPR